MNEKIIKGYNLLKWGIILTALHINLNIKIGGVVVGIQIIPAFIGCFIIFAAINLMYKAGGERYFSLLKKESVTLLILSIAQFVAGVLFAYSDVISVRDIVSPAFIMALYLYELLVYSDILNMTVRLYKDNKEIKRADKLRKDRIFLLKAGLAISLVYLLNMVPKLSVFLGYATITLTLGLKLWITMLLQNVTRTSVTFKKDDNTMVDNED